MRCHPPRRIPFAAVLAAILLAGARPASAAEPATTAAREAVQLCQASAPDAAALARWARGVELAEQAVAERPDDPVAHFALFCNLGRRANAGAYGLSVFGVVSRLRLHIDRALALDPGYADAMAAKGGLLAALPRLLGGDADEGERLLRAALARAPGNHEARLLLHRLLERQGRALETDRARDVGNPAGATPAPAAPTEEGPRA